MKWFLQEGRIRRQLSFGKALGIPRHVDNLNLGVRFGNETGEFRTAQAGHHDVGQQHVELPGMLLSHFQSFRGRLCLQDLVTAGAQNLDDRLAKSRLIVGNEHGDTAAGFPGEVGGLGDWSRRSRGRVQCP